MFTLFQCLFITELSPYLSRRKVCSAGLPPPPLPMNIIVAIQAAYQKKKHQIVTIFLGKWLH